MTQFRLFKLKSSDLRIFSLNNQYFHIRVHVHVFKKSRIFEKKIEFLITSQKLFEAQRCFIPHFNSLEESIWQNFMHVYFKIDISWLKSQNPSLLFHASDNFTKSRIFEKEILWSFSQISETICYKNVRYPTIVTNITQYMIGT